MSMSDDLAWFEANRGPLSRSYPGMYILVRDQAALGVYPDYASAYQAGVAMFGTETFVVKQATPTQISETIEVALKGPLMKARPLMFDAWIDRKVRALGQQYAMDVAEQLRQTGAIIDVTIGVPASLAAQMQGAPPPQTVKGMVDTGASISTVSDAVAAAAGLQQIGSVPIGGVGGTSERPIVAASFTLPQYGLTVDPLEVAVVTVPAPGFEILIGRDLLKALHLDYQGPAGAFNLTQGQGGASPGSASQSGSVGKWLPVVGGIAAVGLLALFATDVL